MKNSVSIEALSEDLETQRTFFSFTAEGRKLGDRIVELGIPDRISSTSARLSEEISAADAEALLGQITSQFTRDSLRCLVEEEVHRFHESPIYTVAAQTIDSEAFMGVVLYSDMHVQVSVVVLPPILRLLKDASRASAKAKGVTVQGNDLMMTFLHKGTAVLSLWQSVPFGCNEPLAPRQASRLPDRTVQESDNVFLEGGALGLSIQQCDGPLLMVLASRKKTRVSVTAHYRADNGQLSSCSAADVRSSRIQLLATVLRELDWKEGTGTLLELTDHPDHFVRWHLMREAIALDWKSAEPYLVSIAAHDPHPQVREAAQQSQNLLLEMTPCL